MFVSFLYPFPLRGRRAAFLWVAFKQMGDLGPDQVAFVASDDYFVDPAIYRRAGRFDCHAPVNPELGFRVPVHSEQRPFRRTSIPESIYRRLKAQFVSESLDWHHLITNVDDELVQAIVDGIYAVLGPRECEAVLTWCNYASLTEATRQIGVPLIHSELGPLRHPWYRPLGYLDFSGVNGQTESEARYRRKHERGPLAQVCNGIAELRAFFSRAGVKSREPDAALGIPLQVEDDSNVLAYGRGFDMAGVIQYARERFTAEELLMRPHPGAMMQPKPSGRIDDSPTSADFVARCAGVLTLNSSVAVEAMLQQKPVTVLGESPARHLAGNTLEEARIASLEELEFLLLNYFVPYQLVFDADYLRWRITGPTEAAIRVRHLNCMHGH